MEPTAEPPRRQDAKTSEPDPALDFLARRIVDAAITVHRTLGPGLLEFVYERCLAYELRNRGLAVVQQVSAPIRYQDLVIHAGFRMDMVVERSIIVEIKAVERLSPLYEAQLLTYLKITSVPIGLLINFSMPRLVDGLRRLINSAALASWRPGG